MGGVMPTNCAKANKLPYVVHHAVAPYYTDLAECATNDVPFDPAAPPPITAGFTLLSPNNDHNGHSNDDGRRRRVAAAGDPELQADPAYQDGSTLIEVTFDEGVSTNQTVAAVFINPALRRHGDGPGVALLDAQAERGSARRARVSGTPRRRRTSGRRWDYDHPGKEEHDEGTLLAAVCAAVVLAVGAASASAMTSKIDSTAAPRAGGRAGGRPDQRVGGG
jgi:hypothetical protein